MLRIRAAGYRGVDLELRESVQAVRDLGDIALSGDTSLQVLVREESGAPLAGAVVWSIAASGHASPIRPASDEDLPTLQPARPEVGGAVTDAHGVARLDDTPGKTLVLVHAIASDGRHATGRPLASRGEDRGAHVEIVMPRYCRLRIRVAPTPPPETQTRASISPLEESPFGAYRYELPLGTGAAEVWLPRGRAYELVVRVRRRIVEKSVIRLEADREVHVALGNVRLLRVRVTDAAGSTMSSFSCRLEGCEIAEPRDGLEGWPIVSLLETGVPGRDGEVVLADPVADPATAAPAWLVLVFARGFAIGRAVVPVQPDGTDTSLVMRLRPACRIEGVLASAPAGTRVRLLMATHEASTISWPRASRPVVGETELGSGGRYELHACGAGRYEVRAVLPTGTEITLGEPDLPEVGIVRRQDRLGLGCVEVRTTSGGAAPPDAMVRLDENGGPEIPRFILGVHEGTLVRFEYVPAGRYALGWPADLRDSWSSGLGKIPEGADAPGWVSVDVEAGETRTVLWNGGAVGEARWLKLELPDEIRESSLLVAAWRDDGAVRQPHRLDWRPVARDGSAWVALPGGSALWLLVAVVGHQDSTGVFTDGFSPVLFERFEAPHGAGGWTVKVPPPARLRLTRGWEGIESAGLRPLPLCDRLEWQIFCGFGADPLTVPLVLPGPLEVRVIGLESRESRTPTFKRKTIEVAPGAGLDLVVRLEGQPWGPDAPPAGASGESK